MVSIMESRPFGTTDPLHSWVKDSNIWRENYNHDWLDSFFSGWGTTRKLRPSPVHNLGINGYRSVAPPTCRPVFPACQTTSHGHNDVEEANTKREDYTKSWIEDFEAEQFPSVLNVNCKPTMTQIADVNNNPCKVREVPIAMPQKEIGGEAKQDEKNNKKDELSEKITVKKEGKAATKRWASVGEGKDGLAAIWSVQSPTVKLAGNVTENSAKKEDYCHDWDDVEVIATQCGLSEVNSKRREDYECEWKQDLLYRYPWESAEGAFYHDAIYVDLSRKTDKMGRPVLRRKLSFGS